MLETAGRELKQTITDNDGRNAAEGSFARRVDELIGVFYDDIGEITAVSTRALFDLFIIKVLYVERRSRDAAVVDYLGQLMDRYLYARELAAPASDEGVSLAYLAELVCETRRMGNPQNSFEAYRKYGDNSLFVNGIFPRATQARRRSSWMRDAGFVDRVTSGKRFYYLAAEHELAELTQQRQLLEKLAAFFEVYTDALNEMSERYIMGFDLNLIADKMLDSFNEYRRTGEDRHLENARRYAAILKVDGRSFPSLLRRNKPRGHVIEPPSQP